MTENELIAALLRDWAYTPPPAPQAVRVLPWYVAAATGAALTAGLALAMHTMGALGCDAACRDAERYEDARAQHIENLDTRRVRE